MHLYGAEAGSFGGGHFRKRGFAGTREGGELALEWLSSTVSQSAHLLATAVTLYCVATLSQSPTSKAMGHHKRLLYHQRCMSKTKNNAGQWPCRFDLGDNAPQVSGVKVYQSGASGADEVIMELDFGWTSDAEMSMIVHPMPHQAWLATPVVEVLSKLIVVKVGASNTVGKAVNMGCNSTAVGHCWYTVSLHVISCNSGTILLCFSSRDLQSVS